MKAVIFDLDDTLYEEKQFVYSGYRAVSDWLSQNYGIDNIYQQLKELFNSGFRGDVFTPVLQKYMNVEEEFIKGLVQIYRSHMPDIELYEDAEYILNKFSGKYLLGMITDGYLITQKNKVKGLNIESIFDYILYSDIYGRDCWKPNIRLYEECINVLKVKPEDSVYVGDNPLKDFINAKKIGMKTIRVIRSNTELCNTVVADEYEADYKVYNLYDIEVLIDTTFTAS